MKGLYPIENTLSSVSMILLKPLVIGYISSSLAYLKILTGEVKSSQV